MTGYESKRAMARDKLTQEPDVVMHCDSHTWTTLNPPPKGSGDVNLYYAPATQRAWIDLTDDELAELSASGLALWQLWRAIEAKLKERNA